MRKWVERKAVPVNRKRSAGEEPDPVRAGSSVRPGSYGRVAALVRQQIQMARGRFTVREIFERLKFEPGVVLLSVRQAFIRLRRAGEIVVSEEREGAKPMRFERAKPTASGLRRVPRRKRESARANTVVPSHN